MCQHHACWSANPVTLFGMWLKSSMGLPTFRYHPDPIATGAVVRESATCLCCGKTVDHVYVASAYLTHEFDRNLCPWCIADGSAHQKYDVEFTDSHPLFKAQIDDAIITEVATRTPGYISWQQEEWMTHCNDACAFLGDATRETVRNMTADEMAPLTSQHGVDSKWFAELAQHYQPGGQPAIYHFRCLHCKTNLFGMDYT
jgi:uncharacterized protein